MRQETLPSNHPHLATSYSNIDQVYSKIGEYSKALSFYENAPGMQQETLPPNHPYLAATYDNMGQIYENTSEYSKALSFYQQAWILDKIHCLTVTLTFSYTKTT